MHIICN